MNAHQALYKNYYKNMFFLIFQPIVFGNASSVLSIIVNGTLIALILKSNRKEFGAYRYLLILFASADIYYGIVHFLIQPIPEAWANAMFMAGHGHITGKVAVCFYANVHSHSYVVLVFHFLYRLLAVKGSRYAQLFSKPRFFLVIAGCGALVGASWFAVMYWLYDTSEFTASYIEPILKDHAISYSLEADQYVIAVFWTNGTFAGPRWKPIIGMVVMAATMGICYGYMVYAAHEISSHMHQNAKIQSDKTHKMTKQLMKALMYQTILPVLTAYSPPLIALSVPLLGLYFPYIADISPLFFGVHPLLDGCVLIYTIKEYRKLLLKWIGCITRPALAIYAGRVSNTSMY